MKNIKLVLEYDGTNYAGWQRQKNAVTIQQVLEDCVYKLTGETVNIIGSSRTDSGVHARGFCANFITDSTIPDKSFRDALNSKLPRDIVVIDSKEETLDFHSRYSSIGKKYSYTILNRIQPSAIERNFVYHYKNKLDLASMKTACTYFIGEHDFSAFRSTGSSVKSSVRTIKDAGFTEDGSKIIFYIEADGFLYNMVRIIVGTLLDIGIGKLKPEDIKNILISKERKKAGKTAPANGLCLEEVFYK